jgi:PAS domain S-box-containing protein
MTAQNPVTSKTDAAVNAPQADKGGAHAAADSGAKIPYPSLLEHLPVCVFRKDADGRFTFVNERFCQLKGLPAEQILGRTADELPGRNIWSLQGAEDHDLIKRTGRSIEREEKYMHSDGAIQYFQVVKSPVFDDQDKCIGSQGLLLEITQRKLAEQELASERELLRSLMNHSPDHVYFKDRNSRFIRASSHLCERFDVTEQEIIGKTDFDFFEEDHARPAFEDEQDIIRSGRPMIGKVEREILKGTEGEFWVLTTKMPLRNEANEIIGTFGISKDITAIKQAEAKLEEAHKQLVAASRMAGMAEVATSVLHNVGNVLNSVTTSCSLVSEKARGSKVAGVAKLAVLLGEHAQDLPGFFADDPKGRQLPEYVKTLAVHLSREQAEIMAELASLRGNIEHIKEIVAMQQSYARVSGVIERLPAIELLEDALRLNAGAIERHQVQVVREYVETPLLAVDKHKVLQILVNLIRNAKYALDDGQRRDKVMTLRVAPVGTDRLKISVTDNGIGVAPENLTRIFAHGFTTRKDGHGFGLHSGALAAREIGGSLTVQSAGLGMGSTFTLELPCQPAKRDGV